GPPGQSCELLELSGEGQPHGVGPAQDESTHQPDLQQSEPTPGREADVREVVRIPVHTVDLAEEHTAEQPGNVPGEHSPLEGVVGSHHYPPERRATKLPRSLHDCARESREIDE